MDSKKRCANKSVIATGGSVLSADQNRTLGEKTVTVGDHPGGTGTSPTPRS